MSKTDWQDIGTAPKDGSLISARGRDWGSTENRFHYVETKFGVDLNGRDNWLDSKGRPLVYLTHWKAAALDAGERDA